MQQGPAAAVSETITSLSALEQDLLTILALAEPVNVTRLTELAGVAGLSETPTRKFGTPQLRRVCDGLAERGLVRIEDAFRTAPYVKHPALRRAAVTRRLPWLASRVRSVLFDSRFRYPLSYYSAQTRFDVEVALAGGDASAEVLLAQLVAVAGPLEAAATLSFPVVANPFDAAWFEGLPESLQSALLSSALGAAETQGWNLGPLFPYLRERPAMLRDSAAVRRLWSCALLSGDLETVRHVAAGAEGEESPILRAATRAIDGRYEEAAGILALPKKLGVAGLPHLIAALLLVRAGREEDLAGARRLARAAAKKDAPFRRAASAVSAIVERTLGGTAGLGFDQGDETDCLVALVRLFHALWFRSPSVESGYAVMRARPSLRDAERNGSVWLVDQYRRTMYAIAKQLPPSEATRDLLAHPPTGESVGRPLFELHTTKQEWELGLEGLERVAKALEPSGAELTDERVVWRVFPRNLNVEPYLQKHKGATFTRGRKLAVKHLLHDAAQLERLPPDDRAVAKYAREARETSMGYPSTYYYFAPQVWTSLIGHPRVELEDTGMPVEVVRGSVQIAARVDGDELALELDPPQLSGAVTVRTEGNRLVVYAVEERAAPLLKLLAKGLRVPVAAKERVLATLGRLSHVLPVQSSERAASRHVVADSSLWLRIVPRGNGLSVMPSVRPLGATGPELEPGRGAPMLLGHLSGEVVQTERDLAKELANLRALLASSRALRKCDPEDRPFVIQDAEACLELLSALKEPSFEVHVEWPEGTPLKLRARVGRKALRGRLRFGAEHFLASGELAVDEELSLELGELLALVSERPGRFLRLSSGDFIELEEELRETLDALSASRSESRSAKREVALPRSAFSAVERLAGDGSGFELDRDTRAFQERLVTAFALNAPVPRGLQAALREYQREGFRWLSRLAAIELGGCLSDDMGLGKTVQVIALLLHRAKSGPALVVAPTSVCDNWQREIARFAPSLEVRAYLGPGRSAALDALKPRSVILTSYAILQQDAERLHELELATAVLDEAQLIKNPESQRSKAACALNARVRIALTGTPVENQIGDLYSIFRFIAPDLLGSWQSFTRRFPTSAEGEAGAAARRALRRLLKPYLLRRTKAQVLEELPERTEIEHSVELSPPEIALYERIRRNALETLAGEGGDGRARLKIIAEITRLRRLCCHPKLVAPETELSSSKLAAFLELVEELVEGGHRALVFSQFVDVLTLARAALDERGVSYHYLDGSTPAARRASAVDAFQAGEGDLFLISLKAGGFGLNLTAADYVIHLDPWWNPAVEAQASDRAHRLGQTRPVTIYRLVAKGTVEERILALHRMKRELADSLLEDSHTSAKLGASELRELLES